MGLIKRIIVKSTEALFYTYYSMIARNDINYQKEFKKIALICVKPYGLGDLIMDTPFISSVKQGFPNSEIHLITDKDIFEKLNEVDEIKLVKGSYLSMNKQFKELRKENYDLGIVMNRAINQTIYLNSLKPRFKLGYLGGYSILSNFKLKTCNLKFDKKEHFSNMALNIADALGIKRNTDLIKPIYSAKTKTKVKKYFESLKLDKKKKNLCINPFVLWESRRWSENKYIELIKQIHKDWNIILYGGKDGLNICKYIEQECSKNKIKAINTCDKLNTKEAVEFLRYVDLFLTSDAGPMHFAFMMKCPTLAIFGPVDPKLRLPLKTKKIFDYVWYKDYSIISDYDYESKHIDKKMNGLLAIPVEDVKKKIDLFYRKGTF